jgi:curved DNA-binding protein CbpA
MTHYEALELPPNAPAADIRRAYRRLVLLTHPDRTPDPAAHARYLVVNAAYETLSDPGRRHAYDLALQAPAGNPVFAPPPGHARKYSPRRNPTVNRATRPGRAGMSHEAIYQKYAPLGRKACWVGNRVHHGCSNP